MWYKNSRFFAAERNARVIRAANNTEAKRATFLQQYDVLQQKIMHDVYSEPHEDYIEQAESAYVKFLKCLLILQCVETTK